MPRFLLWLLPGLLLFTGCTVTHTNSTYFMGTNQADFYIDAQQPEADPEAARQICENALDGLASDPESKALLEELLSGHSVTLERVRWDGPDTEEAAVAAGAGETSVTVRIGTKDPFVLKARSELSDYELTLFGRDLDKLDHVLFGDMVLGFVATGEHRIEKKDEETGKWGYPEFLVKRKLYLLLLWDYLNRHLAPDWKATPAHSSLAKKPLKEQLEAFKTNYRFVEK